MDRIWQRAPALGLCVLMILLGVPSLADVCVAAPRFIAPVDAAIARSFEAPLGPYAAGHRGIDYKVPAGTVVMASSDGVVSFAGPVADDGMFITIRHDVELETTYSFLSRVDVVAGQRVRQGDPIGASGDGHASVMPGLHFGVKLAGAYIDPQLLLGIDLDDISKMISLAPMEEEPTKAFFIDGPSAFGEFPQDGARGESKDFFVSAGSALAKAGRWLLGLPADIGGFAVGAAKAGWAFAKAGWSFAKQAGSWLWSGAKSMGGYIAREVKYHVELLKTVGKIIVDAFKQAWNWVKEPLFRALRFVGSAITKVWRAIVTAISKVFGFVARLPSAVMRLVKRVVGPTAPVRLAKGIVDQSRCGKAPKGPRIPTSAELKAGAKPPPAPNDNIVVAVAGIGSWTMGKGGNPESHASIYQLDFQTLGYSPEQIFHYSYRGLDDRAGGGPYRLHAPYTKEDTYKSIEESALLLDEQLREIHRKYPDKQIDLVAHSQGGLVAQYWVERHYKPGDPRVGEVAHFVTIATPHKGADAAQLGQRLSSTRVGRAKLALVNIAAGQAGLPPPSSPAALEMAEDSSFIGSLNREWDPKRVDTTTIAATFDYVVTPAHTRLKGARHFTVDLPTNLSSVTRAHSSAPKATATKVLMHQILSDSSLACTGFRNAIADAVVGRTISGVQDGLLNLMGQALEGPGI